jgi:hypothetical protein
LRVTSRGLGDVYKRQLSDSTHTLIRVPKLTAASIKAVEETLHRVQGVGIDSVQAPRQTLEELFLDIVEKARAEQVATSGAQSGGRIASFLQGDGGGQQGSGRATEAEAAALVQDLVSAKAEAPVSTPVAKAPEAPKGADSAMLDALVDPSKAAAAASKPVAQPRSAAPEVRKAAELDQGVIDSLLGGSGNADDKNAPGKPGGKNPGSGNSGGQA